MGFDKELIEVAVGSVANRGKFIPYAKLRTYLNESDELYRSMFILEDNAVEQIKKDGGSIANYKGKYKLKHLIFDIDRREDDGDYTRDRAYQFVKTLNDMGVGQDHIQIWFSGRGFHIEISDLFGFKPSTDLPQIVKQTLHNEFGNEIDNIYDKGRIIRVNWSLNKKSGLYKTPLSYEELKLSEYNDIEIIAKDFGQREDFSPPVLKEDKPIWKGRIHSENKEKPIESALTLNSNTSYVPHVVCVQKMGEVAHSSKGRRHQILLRMANAWRRSGISEEGTLALSKLAIPSLNKKEVQRIITSVFGWEHNGYSCNDPIMTEFCDSKCRYYQARNFGVQALATDDLVKKLTDFVMRDHEYSFDLNDMYDLGFSYKFNPGELIVVMGDVKLGKTAWVQNLVTQTKHLKTLFLSLEVSDHLIFRRFMQIANSVSKHEVTNAISDGSELLKDYLAPIKHISVMTKCDLDALKDEILKTQTKFIVIDTLDGLGVNGLNDPFKKQEKVAIGLKQLAQDLNVIVLGISHISKNAAYGLQNVPMLSVHSAKGNSALEQKADKVIGIEGQMDELTRRVRSLASRDESGFTLAYKFNRDTMEFIQEKL